MKKLALLALFIMFPTISFAADSYLCVSDKSTGFYYYKEAGKWDLAKFRADEKYLFSKSETVNPTTKKPLIKWDLKEIGEESSLFTCLEDFSADGTIKCDGFEDKFIMNKNTLRFILIYFYGYWDGVDNNLNNPAIVIGKCSPL
jgi:hypothetical protein